MALHAVYCNYCINANVLPQNQLYKDRVTLVLLSEGPLSSLLCNFAPNVDGHGGFGLTINVFKNTGRFSVGLLA